MKKTDEVSGILCYGSYSVIGHPVAYYKKWLDSVVKKWKFQGHGRTKFCIKKIAVLTWYLVDRLQEFHWIYNFHIVRDRDEVIRFLRSKGQRSRSSSQWDQMAFLAEVYQLTVQSSSLLFSVSFLWFYSYCVSFILWLPYYAYRYLKIYIFRWKFLEFRIFRIGDPWKNEVVLLWSYCEGW